MEMILVFLVEKICREKVVVAREEEKVKIDNFVLAHHLQGSVSLRSALSFPFPT